jgi:hypothetical protein
MNYKLQKVDILLMQILKICLCKVSLAKVPSSKCGVLVNPSLFPYIKKFLHFYTATGNEEDFPEMTLLKPEAERQKYKSIK